MAGRRRTSKTHVAVPPYIHSESTSPPKMIAPNERGASHVNLEKSVVEIQKALEAIKKSANRSAFDEAEISQYEKRVQRTAKWGGWIWGLVSVVAIIFSAGVAYAVFMGENATDSEVKTMGEKIIIEHNGGVDPKTVDSKTHLPVGNHPDIREAIKLNANSIKTIEEKILPPIVDTQKKLDKRSEYQYELTKWESRVNEAQRKRKKAPEKPPRLEKLESDLALGKY